MAICQKILPSYEVLAILNYGAIFWFLIAAGEESPKPAFCNENC